MAEITNVNLFTFAQNLLENDNDGIITEAEIGSFISKAENEDKLEELNIDKNDAISQLKDIFKSEDADKAISADNKDDDTGFSIEHYNELQAKVKQYQDMLGEFGAQKITLGDELKTNQDELENAIKKYETLEKEMASKNEHLQKVISETENTQDSMEADIKRQQKRAVYNAINDYNPEEHGDNFEKYMEETMGKANISSPLASSLSTLVKEQKLDVSELQSLTSTLKNQENIVSNLQLNIDNTVSAINNIDKMYDTTQIQLQEAQEELSNCILNFVSEAEMNLVTENNIDLKEAMPDGNPRYLIAKGKEDDAFHIYDMANGGASLPRQYGCDASGLRGSNICPVGNGYMYRYNELEEGSENGADVYYITDCGIKSKRACYDTCSPLEFAINNNSTGDVNDSRYDKQFSLNTNNTVDFDIDGDGAVDHINDTNNAVLVFDADGDGKTGEDGKEVFGNNTDLSRFGINQKFSNGFEALNALANVAKKSGLINDDNILDAQELSKMEDSYGLKIKANGYNSEATSLKNAGIETINLSNEKVGDKHKFDAFGNEIQTQQGATFTTADGTVHDYADVWHSKFSDEDSKNIKNGTFTPNEFETVDLTDTINSAQALSGQASSLVLRGNRTASQAISAEGLSSQSQQNTKHAFALQYDKNFFADAQKPNIQAKKDETQDVNNNSKEVEKEQKQKDEEELLKKEAEK